jgi:hypothetical protein
MMFDAGGSQQLHLQTNAELWIPQTLASYTTCS